MATFTDPRAFANHVASYGTKIKTAEPRAVKAAALAAVTDIRAEAVGFHIGKAKLRVGYDPVVASVTAIEPKNPGTWKLVERGSYKKPDGWDIYPKRRRGAKDKRRRAVVSVPGRGAFAHVRHPHIGSIGHPWEKGVARAKVSGPKAFKAEMVKVFG